jgi:N-hydroxyarylamine O-acetyltransferase
MELKNYLERINYQGKPGPTLEVLTDLQLTHLLHVPFENLDIHNKIKLDLAKSYEKVVVRNRGGFCYELNSLFFQLLSAIGFDVKMVSARVFNNAKVYGAEFDHMAIIAKIDEAEYLVDVGFGEFAFHPLKIELDKEQVDPRGKFIITEGDENYLIVMKKNEEGEFVPEYKFSMIERKLEDFFGMCEYHQTSPQSHFTQKRICSLATKDGRITISDLNDGSCSSLK